MSSETSNQKNLVNQQSDWLSQVYKVQDKEAAQINGGMYVGDSIGSMQQALAETQKMQTASLQLDQRHAAFTSEVDAKRSASKAAQQTANNFTNALVQYSKDSAKS